MISPDQIKEFIVERYEDVSPKEVWGETSFFVNPGNQLPSGAYFATLKEKDGDNDKASNLDREGIFRLNFGLGRKMFINKFGAPPVRPAKGEVIDGPWDFEAVDELMPHPVYGWMSWMCILNPTETSFEDLLPLLDAAYDKAYATVQKRLNKPE